MVFQIPLNPPLRKGEVPVDVPPRERLPKFYYYLPWCLCALVAE